MEEKDILRMKVVDLKNKLSELGLSTVGLKAALVERLSDYYKSQENNNRSPSPDVMQDLVEPHENGEMETAENGVSIKESVSVSQDEMDSNMIDVTSNDKANDPENEDMAPNFLRHPSKNAKKKRNRRKKVSRPNNVDAKFIQETVQKSYPEGVEIDYVPVLPELSEDDPLYAQFADVLKKFDPAQIALQKKAEEEEEQQEQPIGTGVDDAHGTEMDDLSSSAKIHISKKSLRKLGRMTVAELKQSVKKPEVVDWVDVTANDPYLLVALKACRNSVSVPQHWSQKRKFLQNKRGIEKPPFELPAFIKATGIMEIRQSARDKELTQKLKAKMREKLRPKMGKIDVDYQKLHDAFFKYQTKPEMTSHGDLYYEGKEFEVRYKSKRPGSYSDDLKAALNMPPGGPPPWLINMQRFGPPPSYPFMKIPGLNSPIPIGAQWGFHPGGWGKPPVDEFNRPLYGDVFGLVTPAQPVHVQNGDKSHWGDLLIAEYEMDEEEQEVDMEEDDEDMEQEEEDQESEETVTTITEFEASKGMETPSGSASVPSGLYTPDEIQLKKDRKPVPQLDFSNEQRPLYTVLQQKENRIKGMMGSQHVYDVSGKDVSVAIDPDDLDKMNASTFRTKYEAELQQSTQSLQKEDLSDMVAEYAAGKSGSSSSAAAKKRKNASDAAKNFKF